MAEVGNKLAAVGKAASFPPRFTPGSTETSTPASSAASTPRSSVSGQSWAPGLKPPKRPISVVHNGTQDVLMREYPKPTEDISVAESLTRPALPRSLTSHLKRAGAGGVVLEEDEDTKAKKLADAKKKILALAGKA